MSTLHCSEEKAKKLHEKYEQEINLLTLSELKDQIQFFFDKGVNREILLFYPEIMIMNPAQVKLKIELIEKMKPKNINDYLPFMRMSEKEIERTTREMSWENADIFNGSRIYHFSRKMSIEPHLIATTFVNYPFLFTLPLKILFNNLDLLLRYQIKPEKILSDPWCFLYSPTSAGRRLSRAEVAKSKPGELRPWMIRCKDTILDRSIKISEDTKNALGGEDLIGYISKRLGYSRDETEKFFSRYPPALKVRVIKIKEILDFLIDEAGYGKEMVANVPRVLTFGVKRMKERHEQLMELGYRPHTLFVFCLPDKLFDALIQKIRRRRIRSNKGRKGPNIET